MADLAVLRDSITELLQGAVKKQLLIPYPARTYDGSPKPVSLKYPTPISNKIASSTLYNSVEVFFETDLEDGKPRIVVDFGSADWWRFVDQGRNPSTRMPNIQAIQNWIAQKGAIPNPNMTLEQKTFAAATSIQKYGYYGIKFIDKAFKEVERDLVDLYGQYAGEYFKQILEKTILIEWNKEFKYDSTEKFITLKIDLNK
jgi:hypothetical protein